MKDTKLGTFFDHDYKDILHFYGKIHFVKIFDMKFCKTKITVENKITKIHYYFDIKH
jgi:hypothetical protein